MSRTVFGVLLSVVGIAAGPAVAAAQTTGAAATETYGFSLVDLLEYRALPGSNVLRWDTLGWRGGDVHRFWFKSEGRAPTQLEMIST